MACVSAASASSPMMATLPGAWASNWTLTNHATTTSSTTAAAAGSSAMTATNYPPSDDDDDTPTPSSSQEELDAIRNENHPLPAGREHGWSGSATSTSCDRQNIEDEYGDDDDDDPLDVDADEDDADDFYSFVSHGSQEDTEPTPLPSSLSIIRADAFHYAALRADSRSYPRHASTFDPLEKITEPQQSASRSRLAHCVSASSNASVSASASASTLIMPIMHAQSHRVEVDTGTHAVAFDVEEGENFTVHVDTHEEEASGATRDLMGDATELSTTSRKHALVSVCHSVTGASMDQQGSASFSDDGDVSFDARDMNVGEDDDGDENLVDDYSRRSGSHSAPGSDASSSHSSWHREQRRNGAANRPGALHSTDMLHLTQPNGDSPWTLSLDPTQPSEALSPLSQHTTTSSVSIYSNESSIAFSRCRVNDNNSDDHIPSPSYRQSPAARIRARYYNLSPTRDRNHEVDTSPRRPQESDYSSSYSSPQAYSFPTMSTTPFSSEPSTPPPPFLVYAHTNTSRTKSVGVIKKTKALCSKLKKFVIRSSKGVAEPPPSPPSMVQYDGYDPFVRRNAMDLAEYDMSPPLPYMNGRPSLSLNGQQGSQRTTKISTSSVPLAHRVWHRRTDAVDVPHHVYEPSIPDEEDVKKIKASRRFSLPTFAGSTTGSPRSRRFSTVPPNRRPRLSFISASHMD